jgi:hypothetical protein
LSIFFTIPRQGPLVSIIRGRTNNVTVGSPHPRDRVVYVAATSAKRPFCGKVL